ncbi:MAG TPA: Gldg family protein [Chitinophagales bacterium]|nr:Gldg family protein [Chitinophagales bacterium]
MKKSQLQMRVLLVTVIVILAGFLSAQFSLRLDFTGDKRYTLSKATRDILSGLKEPVTVTAYFSKNLPPNIVQTKNDFKDLLVEYASRSNGNVVYEFIDPSEKPELEQQALQSGIQTVMINVREKDEMKQQKAYLGAVLKMGDQSDVIPFLQPGAAMEYALSSSIKKLSVKEKTKVAFVQGHGEPSLDEMQQVRSILNVLYDISAYTINDTDAIPTSYKTLVIVAPEDSFSPAHLQKLDEYISNGGNLLVSINRVNGDFNTSMGKPVNTGLEEWLNKKGISVEEKFVLDAQCGSVTVQQRQGFFTIQTPVQFPYLPLISTFADHPISKGLERVLLPFASPITFSFSDTTMKAVVLAKTSAKSNTEPGSTFFNVMKNYTNNDFPLASLPVALAVEGKLAGSRTSKMVVFGDGDFAVNGQGREYQQLQPDNVSFFVNAVDWLSDDTGLNELRTKGISSRPIKAELDDSKRTMIKYSNFLAPILLIIVYGFVRMQFRRKKRMKWMEERYV